MPALPVPYRLPEVEAEVNEQVALDSGYQPRDLHRAATTPRGREGDELAGAGDELAGVGDELAGAGDYDLLVIGGGSAAFAAAIRARGLGRTVALVEAGTLGGTCVNVGCVPSKALLAAAELYHVAGHHPFAGLEITTGRVDLAALIAQKDELVEALRRDKYLDLVDAYGFEVLSGHARFIDHQTVTVGDRRLHPGATLIATGASPAIPPISGLEQAGYLTSTTALQLTEVPQRLAVIGANAIGLEFGQFFGHLGAHVTYLDVASRIAPFEEPELSAALTQILHDEGAAIHAPARITAVTHDGDGKHITAVVDGRELTVSVDQVLVATGRRPNTRQLGLEAAGVAVDARGAVVTDAQLRTTNPKVWSAGDVTSAAQFVYVAAYHGTLAADNALEGAGRKVDYSGLPRVIFTAPQVAVAGLTEAAARAAGHQVTTTVLPLVHAPRALVQRDTRGLVKLVADATDRRLLGASLLANGAGDAIQAAVLAIRHHLTVDQLATTLHPYLTMAESLKLAAQTFHRDVAKLSCCAA